MTKIQKLLDEYNDIQLTYKDYAQSMKYILEQILGKYGFNYQVVQAREKTIESLKRKLEDETHMLKENDSVRAINDLAACRIIFYLESDIEKFGNYIWDEFSVVDKKIKYLPDYYNAFHYIIELKENRSNLSEYEKFESLKCEVQLTTVLYHAWSERRLHT